MIKIENVTKSYKQKLVLKDINLNIVGGEVFALIGVNGSGKSTLVDIVCGAKQLDGGKVLIDSIDAALNNNKKIINDLIGYMPQSFGLFNDLTVAENLDYVSNIYDKTMEEVDQVISECDLLEYKNVLAQNLSGGYKQLLSLACALIHAPKILILDEPTSAMDPLMRKKFWHIIKKYNKNGTTILIITHYLEELLQCQRFACLSGGEIRFVCSVDKFRDKGFINIEEILKKYNLGKMNEKD
jgi:ABC-2 type transport system ATP-binding protein